MYNITQITNYDISSAASTTKNVLVGGDKGTIRSVVYKTLPLPTNQVNKFSYCCEVKALQYPIFLTVNGVEKEFQIGKTGMLEVQPEIWQDDTDVIVTVTSIKVPWSFGEVDENYLGFNFKLDFIYS
jgi:hypothetical protein